MRQTIRAQFDQKLAREAKIGIVMAGVFFILMTMTFLLDIKEIYWLLLAMILAVGIYPMLLLKQGFPCPSCQENLISLAWNQREFGPPKRYFVSRLSPAIHFCPSCGISFDEPSPTELRKHMEPSIPATSLLGKATIRNLFMGRSYRVKIYWFCIFLLFAANILAVKFGFVANNMGEDKSFLFFIVPVFFFLFLIYRQRLACPRCGLKLSGEKYCRENAKGGFSFCPGCRVSLDELL